MPSPFGIMSNTRLSTNSARKNASQKTTATMPVLTRPPFDNNQRLLSWPPTQLRLRPTMVGPDDDDSDVPILEREQDFGLYMDEEPLTYFLTPAPDDGDGDGDLAMMDFDAGIGSSPDAADEVRSVSPSSLDGGSIRRGGDKFLPRGGPFRPPTPPRSPPGTPLIADSTTDESDDYDDDDDHEDYIRLGPNHGLPAPPFTLRDFAALKMRKSSRHAAAATNNNRNNNNNNNSNNNKPSSPASSLRPIPSPPASPLSSSPRGRAPGRFGPGRAGGAVAAAVPRRRLSPRSWRQPSPDVWSIDEEPEREACEQQAAIAAAAAAADKKGGGPGAVDRSAKAKKRVRFVLPAKE
ncbi:hypothetical protein RB596_005994 [Gaeumannomyces avenae]